LKETSWAKQILTEQNLFLFNFEKNTASTEEDLTLAFKSIKIKLHNPLTCNRTALTRLQTSTAATAATSAIVKIIVPAYSLLALLEQGASVYCLAKQITEQGTCRYNNVLVRTPQM
jgi:hypothetical protein